MSQCRPLTAALRRLFDCELGKLRKVLVESRGTLGTVGRTEYFTEVILAGAAEPGDIVAATMAGHDGRRLRAG